MMQKLKYGEFVNTELKFKINKFIIKNGNFKNKTSNIKDVNNASLF